MKHVEKYNSLIQEIREMIAQKGRGYNVAQAMNDEFWEELGTHEKRMQEQVGQIQNTRDEQQLQQEMKTADSIYEAARNYLARK